MEKIRKIITLDIENSILVKKNILKDGQILAQIYNISSRIIEVINKEKM